MNRWTLGIKPTAKFLHVFLQIHLALCLLCTSLDTSAKSLVRPAFNLSFEDASPINSINIGVLTDTRGKGRRFVGEAVAITDDGNNEIPLKVVLKINRKGVANYTIRSKRQFKPNLKIKLRISGEQPTVKKLIMRLKGRRIRPSAIRLTDSNGNTLSKDTSDISTNTVYSINITGQGFYGSIPDQTFQVQGALVIVPTQDPGSEYTVQNGINIVDIGIFTNANPLLGVAGALYFGSNTALCQFLGCNTSASAIDVSYVNFDSVNQKLEVVLDGNAFGLPASRFAVFNIYNLRTSLVTQIQHILAGAVTIDFKNEGKTVSGTIELGGSSGFGGPNITTQYLAYFEGTQVR